MAAERVASSDNGAAQVSPSESAKPAFVNKQIFVVPEHAKDAFVEAWNTRAASMEGVAGFLGFDMTAQGTDTYAVESRWASIPEWEAYNLSAVARRQHLPSGIWQHVPKPGQGFPEDFVPFVDMNSFVQAKYPKAAKK